LSASARLPRQLVAYQAELDATAPGHEVQRERLAWQMRRVQKRMAEIDTLLTGGATGIRELGER
jgi:hypothetical protein